MDSCSSTYIMGECAGVHIDPVPCSCEGGYSLKVRWSGLLNWSFAFQHKIQNRWWGRVKEIDINIAQRIFPRSPLSDSMLNIVILNPMQVTIVRAVSFRRSGSALRHKAWEHRRISNNNQSPENKKYNKPGRMVRKMPAAKEGNSSPKETMRQRQFSRLHIFERYIRWQHRPNLRSQ